jgi:hypothetical protein
MSTDSLRPLRERNIIGRRVSKIRIGVGLGTGHEWQSLVGMREPTPCQDLPLRSAGRAETKKRPPAIFTRASRAGRAFSFDGVEIARFNRPAMAAPSPFLLAVLAASALSACAGAPAEPVAAGAEAAAGERGLWIGPVRLCRDTIESASSVRDVDGSAALLVTLKPAAQEEFARWTAGRVGATLPIRLDGRTLSEPVINEPILGGRAQISGLSGDVEAAARAAKGPC